MPIAREAFAEATAPVAKPEKKRTVVKEVLANGIRVIVRENRAVPVVAVQAGFLAGVRAEPKEKGGVAGLTAGMLVKGTKRHTAREIAEAVENMGADLAGYSGRNSFGLQGKFLQRDFEKGFRLFAESLLEPTFPAEELEKKRIETMGALKQQKDQLTQATFLLFLGAHYGDHPYGRNPLGTENVGPRDDVRGSGSVLRAVGGPAEHGDRDLRGHRRGGGARGGPQGVRGDAAAAGVRGAGGVAGPLARCGAARSEERRDKQQAHFVIGYPGARFTDPDRYALDVLGSALAGMGGRLFVNLRDKKSLAYSVTSFSSEQVDPGFFAFYMGTSADKLDGAIADTLEGDRRREEGRRDAGGVRAGEEVDDRHLRDRPPEQRLLRRQDGLQRAVRDGIRGDVHGSGKDRGGHAFRT